MWRVAEAEREPPLRSIVSVPITLKVKSPNEPLGGPLLVTVSMMQSARVDIEQPASVGVTLFELKAEVVSSGNPESLRAIAGSPIAEDPGASIKLNG